MHRRGFSGHIAVILGCILAFSGCSQHEQIVATFGNDHISLPEYENQYLKNSASRDSAAHLSLADRQKFLDLLINYKLKLDEAKREHLESQPAIQNEITQYKGGLTQSFVADRELTGPGVKRLYDRRAEELRAGHILLKLDPTASAADTHLVYDKAREIVAALQKGVRFDSLAHANSIDPSAKQNGGDLYYFSSGMMIPSFEDAVFALKVGEISIIRTQYGLHVVKLLDRRPSTGEIHASHIMLRFKQMNPPDADTLAPYQSALAIKDSIARGIDFADLARRNSSDQGSAPNGGDLGWFARRRWVQQFDEAAFKVKPGTVSDIVRSPYGYHLIKVYEARPRKSLEDSKQELQQTYQQQYYPSEYSSALERAKRSVGFRRDVAPLKEYLATVDSSMTIRDSASLAALTPTLAARPIFISKNQSLRLDSLLSQINQRTDLGQPLLRYSSLETPIQRLEEPFIWGLAADSLARVHPELGQIMDEYRDGVLLYQMEQEHVWNRISPTDSLLKIYQKQHHDRFVWPDRVNFTDIRTATNGNAETVYAMLKAGKTGNEIRNDDSIRMSQLSGAEAKFPKKSATLDATMKKMLSTFASQMKVDTVVTIQLVGHSDSATAKTVDARLNGLKDYLVKHEHIRAARVRTNRVSVIQRGEDLTDSARAARLLVVNVNILGRLPLVIAVPETAVSAPSADERAAHADSLTPGQYSRPFSWKGMFAVVRLNGREKPREKTFEEAQSEVSSAYQDSESERLKDEWVAKLRSAAPIIVNQDALKAAFAPSAK